MIITNNPTIEQEILNRVRNKFKLDNVKRNDGIHLSDLTYCITRSYWSQTLPNVDKTDDDTLMMVLGLALERVLLEDDNKSNRPPIQVKNGVWCSSDYQLAIGGYLGELKTTRAYYNKEGEPTKGYPSSWIKQIAGYSYVNNTNKYMLAVLQIISAKLLGKEFIFTQEELVEYWQKYIIPRKNALKDAFVKYLPPEPFKYNEEWECSRCQFVLNCSTSQITRNYIPAIEPLPSIPSSMVV